MIGSLRAIVAIAFMLIVASATAQQTPPPAFSTTPPRPIPGQPFEATFSVMALPSSVGFWTDPEVSGNTITASFDFGCGFICPGNQQETYRHFSFQMPALGAGSYQVEFISGDGPIAEFPLIVGGVAPPPAAVSLPTMSTLGGALLSVLLLFAGIFSGSRNIKWNRSRSHA